MAYVATDDLPGLRSRDSRFAPLHNPLWRRSLIVLASSTFSPTQAVGQLPVMAWDSTTAGLGRSQTTIRMLAAIISSFREGYQAATLTPTIVIIGMALQPLASLLVELKDVEDSPSKEKFGGASLAPTYLT